MTAIKMTAKARETARRLAIAYSAFDEALAASSSNGIILWGETLIELQDAMGIILHNKKLLEQCVATARRTIQQAA